MPRCKYDIEWYVIFYTILNAVVGNDAQIQPCKDTKLHRSKKCLEQNPLILK